VRAFPKEKVIVQNDRSKSLYSALPYFVSKVCLPKNPVRCAGWLRLTACVIQLGSAQVVAEAPVAAALSAAFGSLLYPLVGFQRSLPKFFNFLALNVVHSFTSSALGLLIGAVKGPALSSDRPPYSSEPANPQHSRQYSTHASACTYTGRFRRHQTWRWRCSLR
jgi:hypothetical protein